MAVSVQRDALRALAGEVAACVVREPVRCDISLVLEHDDYDLRIVTLRSPPVVRHAQVPRRPSADALIRAIEHACEAFEAVRIPVRGRQRWLADGDRRHRVWP